MTEPLVWADVDLSAYAHNLQVLRRRFRPEAKLMAVVKADGYGHGAVAISRQAVASGVDWLGVARVEEGIELRDAGLDAPILIFGQTPTSQADQLFDYRLTPTVYSLSTAQALSAAAGARSRQLPVHVKVDTGMGRLGVLADPLRPGLGPEDGPDRAAAELAAIARLPGLEPQGLYTHFASADRADKSSAERQLAMFLELVERLRRSGLEFPLTHVANSAALLEMPDSHLDLVRPGITTYGLPPSAEISIDNLGLRPVMRLMTRIVHLKHVPAGFAVSYGGTWVTPAPTTIATVAIGYADGLNRLLSSRGEMLLHGRRVPIVGRVCMDLTMLDVGSVPDVALGDEVVVFGDSDPQSPSASELAELTDTISYEVLTSVTARVPRVFGS